MSTPLPLFYTFGNHMHWVDMEWLWGYNVLPDCVRDMLYFCDETGAKGNINFDGVGYEKIAVESPETLETLRKAIAKGQIEVVGGSYGQPYGLFHGGESNVRQRIYGVRTAMRVLGVRPKTFWEEEFDFFPQLPQILSGVGFEYASLFFQWTWHTPEVPYESMPAIWWEGVDGSRLLTSTRNKLNLHQWPEDFAGLLDSPLIKEMPVPGIVQWLELMPSPDWMCRAELLLPQLKALKADPRFELKFGTLSEYLDAARPTAQPRRYRMDDVFHGLSLGKNGDLFRRYSRRAEQSLLTAESISSMMGLFGRPYPHWDVYPTWELEEAWRELLTAQHHDNDECEGLCGHVGKYSYERSLSLTQHVNARSMALLADRTSGPVGRIVAYNPLGWPRDGLVHTSQGPILARDIPPCGYRVIDPATADRAELPHIEQNADTIRLVRGPLSVAVDRVRGLVTQITSAEFPNGALAAPLGDLAMLRNGQIETFAGVKVEASTEDWPNIKIHRSEPGGATITITVSLAPERDAVDIAYDADHLPRPDFGIKGALRTTIAPDLPNAQLIHDYPYGIDTIKAEGKYLRKYPTGEWMTSPQVFEEVHNSFTALQLLDFDDGARGLLYLHDGSQSMLRDPDNLLRVSNILTLYDPWDENYFVSSLAVRVRIVPHGVISRARRWRLAQEFTRPVMAQGTDKPSGHLPGEFGAVWCDVPGAALTAFYRETEPSGADQAEYAGRGMGFPYVLRIVEFNGQATTGRIRLPGAVSAAFRTNLLGEPAAQLAVTRSESALPGLDTWSEIAISLKPHEIATVYLDVVMGRKLPRNLDEHRYVWATVHRVEEKS